MKIFVKIKATSVSWTFESIRSRNGVSAPGRYMYEVEILTADIVQLGWAKKESVFDAEGGTGVGDDEFSYSVDGSRMKKWHRGHRGKNDYGVKWQIGSIIGCCIDLSAGKIAYTYNGTSLGTAFRNIDVGCEWFPAISISTHQACRVIFGVTNDFIYPVEGFGPIVPQYDDHVHANFTRRCEELVKTHSEQLMSPEVTDLTEEELKSPWITHPTPLSYFEIIFTGTEHLQVIGLASRNDLYGVVLAGSLVKLCVYNVERSTLDTDTVVSKLFSDLSVGNAAFSVCTDIDLQICDGDRVGFGAFCGDTVRFYLNGEPLGILKICNDTLIPSIMPYVLNVPGAFVNAGQFGFVPEFDYSSVTMFLSAIVDQ